MVRQFKYHEQKLLKKVDFLNVRPTLLSYFPNVLILILNTPAVEARRKFARNQGHAALPYPRPRRLPQIQQTLRFDPLIRPPPLPPPPSRPLPPPTRSIPPQQTPRPRPPLRRLLLSETLRRRNQAERGSFLSKKTGGGDVQQQNAHGRDGERCSQVY